MPSRSRSPNKDQNSVIEDKRQSSSKKIYFQTSTSRGDQKTKGMPSLQIKKIDKGISGRTQNLKDGANSVLTVKESNKALSAMTKTVKPS